ncbi:Solute carrier organic anion transporter family member 5A1 [Folsomia candida]|uniref:Solute carrier organic anion transporter family member 5A1 n=1 Tax=Folsomia candida TaxID=158441 RepID=A0A226F4H1_FOLCA|nr:Solute carrier organic anion transporter family member 5A1 [Folsomia candida]
MSSRLGQTISRYNTALGNHAPALDIGGQQHVQVQSDNSTSSGNGRTSAVHAMAHQPPPSNYKGHRGHKRGHSYGGVVSPSSSGIHHSQLEARPSHPNTHHGIVLPSHGSSALQKGHRRALSGCLPSAVGAIAWSSLRDLDTTAPTNSSSHFTAVALVRSWSPQECNRPTSPDGTITEAKGKSSLGHHEVGDFKKNAKSLNDRDDGLHSMECGIGRCRLPQCFQRFANIEFFVCILAVLVTLQQGVSSGYVNSVITTIETRFEIPSRFSGLIASSYEMGNVVTVLFVSYLGAKRHIPSWIATGVLVMVVGCVVFTLPHFLSHHDNGGINVLQQSSYSPNFHDPYSVSDGYNSSSMERLSNNGSLYTYNNYNESYPAGEGYGNESFVSLRQGSHEDDPEQRRYVKEKQHQGRNSICHSVKPQSSPFIQGSTHRLNLDLETVSDGESKFPSVVRQELMSVGCSVEVIEKDGTKTTQPSQESYGHPLILFMLAQLLLGCGGSPLFTLGVTYVDDHVPADSSSVYIGIIYAMAAFGPVLGFIGGAWMISIPSSVSHLTNPDARFIGLWWGGFVIAGGLLLLAALPFLTFPRIARRNKNEEETPSSPALEESPISGSKQEALDSAAYGQSIKDIPRSIWRLITNPTYVLTCLGGCMELNIVSGFVVFLPKYLETQFSMGKSKASLYTGGIAIPGACLGIFFGGWLVKRMQMKPSGACKFVVTTNILCLAGYVLFFFLGCSNPNLAGATVSYPGLPTNYAPLDINLTSSCNSDCNCDFSLDAQYVCHEKSGVTYFSPCHAGCSVNLTQCTCAGGDAVESGACHDTPCNTLLPFMIVLFFMTATVSVTQMPLLMIVLRSVSPEERSFALGMQFVIFRLLGYIPSPIVFGSVIDSACLLWSIKRCSVLLPAVSGRCLLYDIADFRYKYVGMLSGLKLLALALFLYDLYQLRKLEKKEEAEEAVAAAATNGDNLKSCNSIISLDKCKAIPCSSRNHSIDRSQCFAHEREPMLVPT